VVLEEVGILLGMQSATRVADGVKNLDLPAFQVLKALSCIEFAAEVGEYINRVISYANRNGVGVEYRGSLGLKRSYEGVVIPAHGR